MKHQERNFQVPALVLVFLSLCLVACSKHPSAGGGNGSAEPFGGGDPLLSKLNGLRHNLQAGADQLMKDPTALATLCQPGSIQRQQPDFFIYYPTPDATQQRDCGTLLQKLLQSGILADESGSPFEVVSVPVGLIQAGLVMDFLGVAPIGRRGAIQFFDERINAETSFQLGMAEVHELLHEIPGSPLDTAKVDGFNANFLDYAGASLWAAVLTLSSVPASPTPDATPSPTPVFPQASISSSQWEPLLGSGTAPIIADPNIYTNGIYARALVSRYCRSLGYAGGVREDLASTGGLVLGRCLPSDTATFYRGNAGVLGAGCPAQSTWAPDWQISCDQAASAYCRARPEGYSAGVIQEHDGAVFGVSCLKDTTSMTLALSEVQALSGVSGYSADYSQGHNVQLGDDASHQVCNKKGYQGGFVYGVGHGNVALVCF